MSESITGAAGEVLVLANQFEEKVSEGICVVRPIIDDIVAAVSKFGDQVLATNFVIELMTGQSSQSPASIREDRVDCDVSRYLTQQLAGLRNG